jgi:hypothetical protein
VKALKHLRTLSDLVLANHSFNTSISQTNNRTAVSRRKFSTDLLGNLIRSGHADINFCTRDVGGKQSTIVERVIHAIPFKKPYWSNIIESAL